MYILYKQIILIGIKMPIKWIERNQHIHYPIKDRYKEKPLNQNYLPLLIEDPPELPELQ